jgi:hypothetical protein
VKEEAIEASRIRREQAIIKQGFASWLAGMTATTSSANSPDQDAP